MKAVLIAILMQVVGFSALAAQTFGKGEFSQTPVTLADLMKEPGQYKDKTVVVKGQVSEVCKKEGCWLKLQDQKTVVRTIMKDHGFKVPTDIQNKTVLVEGKLVEKELPANAVKHYMKDEGKSEDEINKVTGPQKVFQFIADGVKLG